jgi:hypothetical protein
MKAIFRALERHYGDCRSANVACADAKDVFFRGHNCSSKKCNNPQIDTLFRAEFQKLEWVAGQKTL